MSIAIILAQNASHDIVPRDKEQVMIPMLREIIGNESYLVETCIPGRTRIPSVFQHCVLEMLGFLGSSNIYILHVRYGARNPTPVARGTMFARYAQAHGSSHLYCSDMLLSAQYQLRAHLLTYENCEQPPTVDEVMSVFKAPGLGKYVSYLMNTCPINHVNAIMNSAFMTCVLTDDAKNLSYLIKICQFHILRIITGLVLAYKFECPRVRWQLTHYLHRLCGQHGALEVDHEIYDFKSIFAMCCATLPINSGSQPLPEPDGLRRAYSASADLCV